MISDTKLRKSLAKRRESIEILSDSNGLNVRISATGKITFFYRYRWKGREVQLSIGEYPSMTIAQARERRHILRGWLNDGSDPREMIQLERRNSDQAMTVNDAFNYWIEKHCIPRNIKKIDYYRVVYAKHISPDFGDIRLCKTTRRNWLDILDKIDSPVMANYMTALCKRAFSFCLNRGVIDVNPIADLRPSNVGTTPKKGDRQLTPDELKMIWKWLNEHQTDEAKFLIKFVMLTGCRTAEIRLAKWEWFNFDDNTWTVPSDEYKTGSKVRRALTEEVRKLLLERKERVSTSHVLTSSRMRNYKGEQDRPINPSVASNYAKFISVGTGITDWGIHDFRRTIATKLSEMGCPPHVIEKILGHKMTGVMAHYNLHDYMDDQRHWLKVWEEYIMRIVG
ncbi:tyrosine-type recombinase/integrase [Pectobacterium parmentieri]|uniref:tyrosine-type recombinase/integrase n=1 Tax=Pectobacterium parmentieri TaxID=1905730 RepID=UPI000D60D33A|nr:site-specific integrase [Pectobacterium parmentieri]PWD66551.1 integrase [Pectobacterium parmentieri]